MPPSKGAPKKNKASQHNLSASKNFIKILNLIIFVSKLDYDMINN